MNKDTKISSQGTLGPHPDIFPLKNKSFSTKLFLAEIIFEVEREMSLGNSMCLRILQNHKIRKERIPYI